jgi:thiol-disulfide isomerase/thioredoxin
MKTSLVILSTLLFFLPSFSQKEDIDRLLRNVKQAQSKIQTASFVVHRTDTSIQDIIRFNTGNVIMERDNEDSIFGFRFKGKLDSMPFEIVYDGYVGYEADTDKKTYLLFRKADDIKYLLYRSGGWLVIPELLKIDTSGIKSMLLTQDARHYYLTFYYPDLKEYDVEARRKILSIDKEMMLPVAVRSHQETYGKVQDLYWKITSIQVNQPLKYDFAALPFLNDYAQSQPSGTKPPVLKLKGTKAPDFTLELLNGTKVAFSSLKEKVILLDFWEVWCGPCIVSMPKVQALYDKYKGKGLVVYGIVNDQRNIQSTKEFVKKRSINLPVLIGDEQFQKNYKFDGSVPLYLLINKKGEVSLVQFGFSDNIETLIRKELEM